MNAAVWRAISEAIRRKLGGSVAIDPVAGGCIHHSAVVTPEGCQSLFIKTNDVEMFALFEAEAAALETLAETKEILVPTVIDFNTVEKESPFAYLAMSFLPLLAGSPASMRQLGEQVAGLHRHTSPDGRFGFSADNFIGATAQPNPWTESWAEFFAEHRLAHQFELSCDAFEHADKLSARVPDLLGDHDPSASLLHGDLWSGNVGFTPLRTPVIFDPACYYGDREADIAFTEMFGGFGPEFYSGYRSVYPLDEGYEVRRELYNLYHVLNHHHLFGGSYGQQAEAMIRRLLVGF